MNAASSVRRSLALALAMALSACTHIPRDAPPYKRAARAEIFKANLYFYRKGTRPSLLTPTVLVDGRRVFEPLEGTYTVLTVSEGIHIVKIEWPWTATLVVSGKLTELRSLEFPVTIGDRDEVYLRITVNYDYVDAYGNMSFTRRLSTKVEPMPQVDAEMEMLECCRYIAPASNVRSRR